MGGAIYSPLSLHDMYRDSLTLCRVLIPINNAAFQCSPVSYAVRRFGNSGPVVRHGHKVTEIKQK